MKSLSSHFGCESELVFWTFRYFLGRQSIHTSVFASQLAEAWPLLEEKDQNVIRKELEEAFTIDDEMIAGNSPFGDYHSPLGRGMREAWQRVRDAYSKNVSVNSSKH